MAGASSSSSQSSQVKEYVVRVPKSSRKKYHMMRFNADLGNDFFKNWGPCKIERENNFREFKMGDETPKFGAGSEFGREQREEARRKRYGINIRKYKSENQPWMLSVGGKNGKKFKGIREGGVADNVSWYVFMQGKDGAFEAYPVDEWYNFQPVNRYKALSAEQAEEEFVRRDKIMNYFQMMYEKKFRKDGGEIDEEGDSKKKGGSSKKSLLLSEMDDWLSDEDEEGDGEEDRLEDSDDGGGGGKKKKKKHLLNKKRKQGGKKNKKETGPASDDSCVEESDEYNEGAEHDYILSDSSDSDQENEEVVNKELAGVEEGDALKKLLASDDEDENEENKDKKDEEKPENEEEEKEKKKKKNKRKKSDSEGSSNDSSDDNKKEKNTERKHAVNELKKKVKENPLEMGRQSKKMKLESGSASGASTSPASTSATDQMEEALRRYLLRKPMTTTELLKQLKKKLDMSSEQLVTNIASLLKKVNPNKRMIKGKMYLSLKPV